MLYRVESTPAAPSMPSVQDRGAAQSTPLLVADETHTFRSRWDSIQTGFVDEPRRSVEQADGLVAEVMKRLARHLPRSAASSKGNGVAATTFRPRICGWRCSAIGRSSIDCSPCRKSLHDPVHERSPQPLRLGASHRYNTLRELGQAHAVVRGMGSARGRRRPPAPPRRGAAPEPQMQAVCAQRLAHMALVCRALYIDTQA